MKLIKDEDIALAIQPGWLVKLKGESDDMYYSDIFKCYDFDNGCDQYELVFELDGICYDAICEGCYNLQANLDPHIMAVYKLSKRGNFIKVWERD